MHEWLLNADLQSGQTQQGDSDDIIHHQPDGHQDLLWGKQSHIYVFPLSQSPGLYRTVTSLNGIMPSGLCRVSPGSAAPPRACRDGRGSLRLSAALGAPGASSAPAVR